MVFISKMRTLTGEKLFSCQICNKSFSRSSSHMVNIRIHSAQKLSNCQICDKQFSTSGSLQTHTKIHTGENASYVKRSFLLVAI